MPGGRRGVVKPEVGDPDGPAARLHRERPACDRGHDRGHLRLHVAPRVRVALPARDPDRRGDQGRPRRGRALPARAHRAVRRPAPASTSSRCSPQAGRHRRPPAVSRAVILAPAPSLRVGLMLLLAVVLQISALEPDRHLRRRQADLVAAGGGRGGVLRGQRPRRARPASPPASCSTSRSGAHDGRLLAGADRGRLRRRPLPRAARPGHGLMPIPVGAAATAGWVLAFAAVSFMLDVDARGESARLPRHGRHGAAERAARDPGLRRLPQGPAARRSPSTRWSSAAAASAPARPGPLGLRGLEV